MAHLLYVVARTQLDLYDRLRAELAGDGGVRILVDRRRGERRLGERREGGGRGLPGRRGGEDRRRRPDLEVRLAEAGFFTVRLHSERPVA